MQKCNDQVFCPYVDSFCTYILHGNTINMNEKEVISTRVEVENGLLASLVDNNKPIRNDDEFRFLP